MLMTRQAPIEAGRPNSRAPAAWTRPTQASAPVPSASRGLNESMVHWMPRWLRSRTLPEVSVPSAPTQPEVGTSGRQGQVIPAVRPLAWTWSPFQRVPAAPTRRLFPLEEWRESRREAGKLDRGAEEREAALPASPHRPSLFPSLLPPLSLPLCAPPVRAMRHGRRVKRLGRPADQRKALLRGLTTQVLRHGRVTTTVPRAKALRGCVDRMITLAKRGTLHARRQALAWVYEPSLIRALFLLAPARFAQRQGGYCRYRREAEPRRGDNAPLATVELV